MLLAPEVNGLCYQWLLLESFLTCTEWADRPSRCWLASDQSVTSGLSSHWQWQEACCASSVHVFLSVTWKKSKISKIGEKTSNAVIMTAMNTHTNILCCHGRQRDIEKQLKTTRAHPNQHISNALTTQRVLMSPRTHAHWQACHTQSGSTTRLHI